MAADSERFIFFIFTFDLSYSTVPSDEEDKLEDTYRHRHERMYSYVIPVFEFEPSLVLLSHFTVQKSSSETHMSYCFSSERQCITTALSRGHTLAQLSDLEMLVHTAIGIARWESWQRGYVEGFCDQEVH